MNGSVYLMSHPDPAVLPVGTLYSLEWFWVSRRIFVYSHHNTIVFISKMSVCPSVCLSVCLSVTPFYPRPVLAFGYCRCLRLSVRPSVSPSITKFVRAITHHPFELGSPNLDHRCKRPWLRSLLFLGVIDPDLQGQILLQSQNLPHFELVRLITHHPFKLGPPNLDQRC